MKTHSPAKPRTLERYREALAHFERLLGHKKYVEAITRTDIDDYKIARSYETVGNAERPVSPATINFEGNVFRTFFYYLVRERGISMENPCAHFKPLRSQKERLKRRPSTYSQEDLDKIFKACDQEERSMFAALLLSGLRKQELTTLTWSDLDLNKGTIRIRAKEDFAPKDYEEREIPIPRPVLMPAARVSKIWSSRENKVFL